MTAHSIIWFHHTITEVIPELHWKLADHSIPKKPVKPLKPSSFFFTFQWNNDWGKLIALIFNYIFDKYLKYYYTPNCK